LLAHGRASNYDAGMCGRAYDSDEAARERENRILARDAARRVAKWARDMQRLLPFNYDIRPTNEHAVVSSVDDVEVMRWGFKPEWSKMLLFNSRHDKLEGRVWGKAFRERRCLLPVGGFYEWTGPKNARKPHAISLADGTQMLLACLWLEHESTRCFSIITTDASPWMSRIHDREPVIVRPQDAEEYLESKEAPMHLIRASTAGELDEFSCGGPFKDKPPVPQA
jgi:putative SOS response-associated peptidase YedK